MQYYRITVLQNYLLNSLNKQIKLDEKKRIVKNLNKENYIYSYGEAIDSGAKTCLDFYQYYFRFKTIEAFDLLVKTIKFCKTK